MLHNRPKSERITTSFGAIVVLVLFGLTVGVALVEVGVIVHQEWIVWRPYSEPPAYRADPNHLRLAVLGGSTAKGSPYHGVLNQIGYKNEFNLLSIAKIFLERRYGTTNVTVDSYANGGWPIEEAVKHYWKSAKFKPDVMVLYSGHNEHWSYYSANMKPPPGYLSFLAHFNTGRLLLRSSFLREAKVDDRIYRGGFFAQDGLPDYETAFNRARYKRFVELLIKHCKTEGIFLIIVVPEGNYLMPPTRSVYRGPPERRAEALRAFKSAFYYRYVERNLDRAQALLEGILEYAEFADAHYELGAIHQARGNVAGARSHLGYAIDTDVLPTVMQSGYKKALRQLAASYDVPLIEMGKLLSERLDVPVPDYSVFIDNCHFQPVLYELLAQEIVRILGYAGYADLSTMAPESLTLSENEWANHVGLNAELIALGVLSANKWKEDESVGTFLRLRALEKPRQMYTLINTNRLLPHLVGERLARIDQLIEQEKARTLDWIRDGLDCNAQPYPGCPQH